MPPQPTAAGLELPAFGIPGPRHEPASKSQLRKFRKVQRQRYALSLSFGPFWRSLSRSHLKSRHADGRATARRGPHDEAEPICGPRNFGSADRHILRQWGEGFGVAVA